MKMVGPFSIWMIKGVKTLYNDPTVKNFKHILVHNDNERQENSIGWS